MPETIQFHLLWPEFLVAGLAFLVFTVDFVLPSSRSNWLAGLAATGLAVVALVAIPGLWSVDEQMFGGLLQIDRYAVLLKLLFLGLGVIVILSSAEFVQINLTHTGEFFALIVLSVLGTMLLCSSSELLTAYISLELLSFTLYVLASYARSNPKSNEAGVKYILLGAFSSALLLFGISLIYGTVGDTRFIEISEVLQQQGLNVRLLLGLTFLLAGVGFKLSAVPFHMWAPDVYEGAPLPVTAHIASLSKVAAFALVIRLCGEGLLPIADRWRISIGILAALTMVLGNILAIVQTNIKRMLAYSSIGQVGYVLMGIAAFSALAVNGMLFHLIGYALTNLTAFLVITTVYNRTSDENILGFTGLADRAPFLALALSVSFFSLAGMPFFAGFTTKFYLFTAVANEGLLWLVAIAAAASLVSLYYYLMVIKIMYLGSSSGEDRMSIPPVIKGTIVALLVGVIIIGVYPGPLVELIETATNPIAMSLNRLP